MIVTADWVLPVEAPPIRDGAVRVDGGRIVAVGKAAALVAGSPDDPVEAFAGAVIIPGLVNAHTHLSLTVLEGLVGPMAMAPFLARVTRALEVMGPDEFAASAARGALQCLRNGVTCVGDIAYDAGPARVCGDAGLAGVFHIEVLGVPAGEVESTLGLRGLPDRPDTGGRVRLGVSPHTPYTLGPAALLESARIARRRGMSLAIHIAESPAERELMCGGTGPLAAVAGRLAHGFVAPGTGSVAYLANLGVLHDALAVHCANLEPGDPGLLATARGVALCPRSNAYLHNGRPPVAALREAGVRLAFGTDSPASNTDLDLFEEARAVMALDPGLTPERALQAMTSDGAACLGTRDRVGALAPGLDADLTVVRSASTEDPVRALLATARGEDVAAVMTAGEWRVRDGAFVADVASVERAAAAVRAGVEAALLA